MRTRAIAGRLLLAATIVAGCATSSQPPPVKPAPPPPPAHQVLALASGDGAQVLQVAIATLLDMGFLVDGADSSTGTVNASKFLEHRLRVTVAVEPAATGGVLVRMVARYAGDLVTDPGPYRDFFAELARGLGIPARPAE